MTAAEIVARYVEEIYHSGRVAVVREICGDPMIRHAPGGRTALSQDEQIARIEADLEAHQPRFTTELLAGDAEHAVLVWSCTRVSGETLSGIEVFRVWDGRITDVWNAPYAQETWQ